MRKLLLLLIFSIVPVLSYSQITGIPIGHTEEEIREDSKIANLKLIEKRAVANGNYVLIYSVLDKLALAYVIDARTRLCTMFHIYGQKNSQNNLKEIFSGWRSIGLNKWMSQDGLFIGTFQSNENDVAITIEKNI